MFQLASFVQRLFDAVFTDLLGSTKACFAHQEDIESASSLARSGIVGSRRISPPKNQNTAVCHMQTRVGLKIRRSHHFSFGLECSVDWKGLGSGCGGWTWTKWQCRVLQEYFSFFSRGIKESGRSTWGSPYSTEALSFVGCSMKKEDAIKRAIRRLTG